MKLRTTGRVTEARDGFVRAFLPGACAGDAVLVGAAARNVRGLVRGIAGAEAAIATLGPVHGIVAGDTVTLSPEALTLPLGMYALGRAFDAAGNVLDDRGALRGIHASVVPDAPLPHRRLAVTIPFWTGVRVIDGLLTFGRGARVGLFGTPGAGKSTLLAQMARGASADAVVIGLIGERGREAAEWIARCGARTTVVCAASDRSAAERVAAAHVCAAQAHALRSRGLQVLLIIDSLARFAAAQRELGIASGESAGRGGFPASVFSELARLVEIAGITAAGSVTLVATVLSEAAVAADPVAEAARSLLDGHIMLSERLANAGRFPAVDVLSSASRTMAQVCNSRHLEAARCVRGALDTLAQNADARSLGLPVTGAAYERAVAAEPALESFLRQGELCIKPASAVDELGALADILEERSWTSHPTS